MKIIGVAGGSGSGKTTFATMLQEQLGGTTCATIIAQDSYYIDQSHRFDRDGGAVNFDHPDSLDWPLMTEHLAILRSGEPVEVPHYNFATHKREKQTQKIAPNEFIIVDGILIFSQKDLLKEIDYKIFVDCPESLRFERRMRRDVVERGRTPEGVTAQFLNQVKPMHDLFVEPTKSIANIIVRGDEDFRVPMTQVLRDLL